MKTKLTAIVTMIVTMTILIISLVCWSLQTGKLVHAGGNLSITRTLQPSSADTFVRSDIATTNYGAGVDMRVQGRGVGPPISIRRSLVQLDLSSIPSGSSVSSSTLQLYLITATTTSRTHDANRITGSWAEGTATWNLQPAFNATATASATTGITSGVWMSWTVTTDVSAYVGGTATNYGWFIKDSLENETAANQFVYATKENLTTANRPKLSLTFTAPWDSYQDSGRTIIDDAYANPYNTVYMKGTGFATASYNVGYYDGTVTGGGNLIATDNNISVTTGVLNSQYLLTTNPNAIAGTWHTLVQPASGYSAFPSTYNTAVAAPDTYGLLANDSFTVEQSAIPEFPTVITAIAVAGMCFGIYYWMRRKRRLAHVKA